jgi:hypothetical protein
MWKEHLSTGSEVPYAVRTKIGGLREDTKDKCVEWGVI